jgi:hypothetical protein
MIDDSNSPGKFAPASFALRMLELGRVPLPLTGKAVTWTGWTKQTVETVRERFDRLFPPGYTGNVGCLLGEASGSLVDIDLDCVESIRAAEVLLPPTPCRWGRASNPGWSHMAFRVEPCPAKTTSFAGPHGKLLEIRSNKCQTLVYGHYPPSEKRPTPEPVCGDFLAEPARVTLKELNMAAQQLAAASLLGQNWTVGQRHDATLALCGWLLKRDWPPSAVARLLTAICRAANDNETDDRLRALGSTQQRLAAGLPVMGWPALVERLGAAVSKKLDLWLGDHYTPALEGFGLNADDARLGEPPGDDAPDDARLGDDAPDEPPDDDAPDEPPDDDTPTASGGRPQIIVTPNMQQVADRAIALLPRSGLYQRGGLLVHTVEPDSGGPAGLRRVDGAPIIRPVQPATLAERLSALARWRAANKRGWLVDTRPPGWCISAVLARGQYPGLPVLDGVLNYPVILPDGRIVSESGYHRSIRSIVCGTRGLKLSVPDRPTLADAQAAVETLGEILCDFPFTSDAHRAAWFAGLLTPLAWFAFDGCAPLFCFDGNVRGCGKGLAADLIGLIVTGSGLPIMSYTPDAEELRKRISSFVCEGVRLCVFDNIVGQLGNHTMDAALTATVWRDRLLGTNQTITAPLQIVWYATGNNVSLGADTARRVLPVRLETAEEKPEQRRNFRFPNLREHVRERRAELLSAALTIARAYIVAGMPRVNLPSWGSFEGWSRVVRECLVWAGMPDPAETRAGIHEHADRDALNMAVILRGLRMLDPQGRGLTCATILERAREFSFGDREPWQLDLAASIEELLGQVSARTLGYKFRAFRRRNFGGLMLDTTGADRDGGHRWVVRAVGGKTPPDELEPDEPRVQEAGYSFTL